MPSRQRHYPKPQRTAYCRCADVQDFGRRTMALTPADVHNVAFSRARIGKRGYSEQEVDLFIDLVEQELTRHIEVEAKLAQRGGQSAQIRHREAQLARVEAELGRRRGEVVR